MTDVKRYEMLLGDLQGRIDASKLAMIQEAIDKITALQARSKEAVETLRKGFKSGDPTKTAAAIILAIAQLEGHGE